MKAWSLFATIFFLPSDKKRSNSVLGDLFRRNSPHSKNKGFNSRLQNIGDGYRYINRGASSDNKSEADHMESVKTKNAVYSAIVLEEFLKELAAVCQEHAVRPADEPVATSWRPFWGLTATHVQKSLQTENK